jgi:hypothetical protein
VQAAQSTWVELSENDAPLEASLLVDEVLVVIFGEGELAEPQRVLNIVSEAEAGPWGSSKRSKYRFLRYDTLANCIVGDLDGTAERIRAVVGGACLGV